MAATVKADVARAFIDDVFRAQGLPPGDPTRIAQQAAAVQAQAAAAPNNQAVQDQLQTATQQLAAKNDLLQQIATVYQNEHFLRDILSDADGLSIHRFQMVVWTLVLSFIFAK